MPDSRSGTAALRDHRTKDQAKRFCDDFVWESCGPPPRHHGEPRRELPGTHHPCTPSSSADRRVGLSSSHAMEDQVQSIGSQHPDIDENGSRACLNARPCRDRTPCLPHVPSSALQACLPKPDTKRNPCRWASSPCRMTPSHLDSRAGAAPSC